MESDDQRVAGLHLLTWIKEEVKISKLIRKRSTKKTKDGFLFIANDKGMKPLTVSN